MLKYLAKVTINDVDIALLESQHSYCVIYGMERTTFRLGERNDAWKRLHDCIDHARDCMGEGI